MKNVSLVLLMVALSGCDNNFDGKPAAVVQSQTAPVVAAPAEKPAEKEATARTVSVAADRSEIGFVGAKITGKHSGKFRSFTGEAKVVGDTAKQISFTVQMASVESDDAKLTEHLKAPDFFDVEKYPTSAFQSSSIVEKAAGEWTHEITGNLTMHGVTKAVTFPAKVTVTGDGVTGKAEFTINRKDFGIVFPGKPDDLIKDDVLLTINLGFPKS